MLLFLILLLPLFLAAYCVKVRTTKIVPVILIGSLSAVLVVVFKMLFIMSHRIVPFSFGENFVYFLVKETLIPAVVLYVIYFLVAKDNVEFKINTYLPLELAFYSVYLPYCVISTTDSIYSWFSIFVKPLIYAIMIAQTGVSLRDLYRSSKSGKKGFVVLNAFIIFLFFAVPPVMEAAYIMNYKLYVILLICAAYILLPILLYYFSKKRNLKV